MGVIHMGLSLEEIESRFGFHKATIEGDGAVHSR